MLNRIINRSAAGENPGDAVSPPAPEREGRLPKAREQVLPAKLFSVFASLLKPLHLVFEILRLFGL